jgi:GT2 family glycosyltransferase
VNIAVLIACFNRKEKTLNCLKALYQQKGMDNHNVDVFLLDDKSTDGTSEAVGEFFPKVHIIIGTGSLYWNRGMHTAWRAASIRKYDFYLWLNDDTLLYEHGVSEMLFAACQTNNKAIICGCTESPFQPGELTYGGGSHRENKYYANYPDGRVIPCDIINGNCVLVPQYVFEKAGNLDWNFHHGIGDNDYSLRAKKIGILSYTAANFIGTCAKHATLPKWCIGHVTLKERIKNLYSPLGNPPFQFFLFERRHFGLGIAIRHFVSTHIRVVFPRLWQ